MRGATGVIVQPHQILRLPRKMTVQYVREIWWKQMKRHFQCATDPRMIRAWSDHETVSPQPASQPRLLFALTTSILYWKIQHFALRLSFQISPNSAPATQSDIWSPPNTAHQILRLVWKVTLQLHQMLRLPRKVTLGLHQRLHLPRKVALGLHQILHLPRKVTWLFFYVMALLLFLTLLVLDSSITWLFYCLTLLLPNSTITSLSYYLTLLLLNLTLLLLDPTITWFFSYLTLLLLKSSIT